MTEYEVDQGMHDKGYRYKMSDRDGAMKPIYSKTLDGIGSLMQDFRYTRFNIRPLYYDWKIVDLLDLWKDGHTDQVIHILSDDHPGLAVMFLSEGVSQKVLSAADRNILVNQLMGLRLEIFQG